MSDYRAIATSGEEVILNEPPIFLTELGDRMYLDHHSGKFPDGLETVTMQGSYGFVTENGKPYASLAYRDDAHWGDRGRTHGLLLGVNHAGTDRLTRFLKVYPEILSVLDISVDAVSDPQVPSKPINPADLLYAATQDDAVRLGSWIVDADVRSKVVEWADAQSSYHKRVVIEKWITLRRAPHIRDDQTMPVARDRGSYSYRNILDDIRGENLPTVWDARQGKSVPVGRSQHIFTEEDLQWLDEYMNTLGVPTPND
jgi:hypothetical protein